MDILVVGSGGREHAIVWRLRKSPSVNRVLCAPGNPGIASEATLAACKADDLQGLLNLAKSEHVDLTVVGPEGPLASGIVDLFEENGMAIFGPSKEAARLEWSKGFAKDFMTRHGIPTAAYRVFGEHEMGRMLDELSDGPFPLVLKADGLAAGKGVLICRDRVETIRGIREIIDTKAYGKAGEKVVVEEFLEGDEASLFVVCDGTEYLTLAPARDYKRVFDNDRGRNTGGMGSIAPAPVVSEFELRRICRTIVEPTLRGMAAEGRPYRGCLYVGLMLTPDGPRVIEFNSRFGDPETQVVLPLFEGDLGDLLLSAATHRLADWKRTNAGLVSRGAAVCVILASEGYPGPYQTGRQIRGLGQQPGAAGSVVFHAGTALSDGKLVTSGGRVLGITAISSSGDIAQARDAVYREVERISFDGMHFRRDIGQDVLKPSAASR